jgi:hypothetical protein
MPHCRMRQKAIPSRALTVYAIQMSTKMPHLTVSICHCGHLEQSDSVGGVNAYLAMVFGGCDYMGYRLARLLLYYYG